MKNKWQLSKYVLFTKPQQDNSIIAFNLFKGIGINLNEIEFSLLSNLDQLSEKDPIFQKFKEYGIVVNYNELEMIQVMSQRSNSNSINLTICPTLACNFDCPYCFENHTSGKMSEDIQDKIVKLVEQIIDTTKSKNLKITWYGGEPLLGIDIIDKMSQKLIALTNEKQVNYSASIITNGYLLTQNKVDILFKNKVLFYQITLDGLEEAHNATRHLANGDPTFDVIIENLRNLHIPGKISIRHNIHNGNKDETHLLEKLIEIIAKQSGNNLSYYPAIVFNNPAKNRKQQIEVLNEKDACKIRLSRDFKNNFKMKFKNYYCGAQNLYCISIDNEGRLYKCWEDVDKPERSFGHVNTWDAKNPFFSAENPDILSQYLNKSSIFLDEECKECKLLPICAGECPSKRFYSHKNCLPYKNHLDELANIMAKNFCNKN